jgi:3'-phosphoadenosine 5'-phosphosulfate sulfotransferase (PAPS reductase)/FAD synthetase
MLDRPNPYLIDGPALISFSGGRTSGYMLHEIVRAHGGTLPDDLQVCFANTGKERPETLRFVHECATRWGVRVRWLEWRPGKPGFEEVGFNSASRMGEPFKALIDQKQRLPNGHERWCTQFLKVLPMYGHMRAQLGLEPGQYAEIIGLRHDEGLRIFKGMDRAEKDSRRVLYPIAKAKRIKADVLAFWRAQAFDLGLEPWEGNCDLCFQKGKGIRKRIIRDDPSVATWWADREREQDGWFDKRDRVEGLVDQVRRSPTLFEEPDDLEFDVECGLQCELA